MDGGAWESSWSEGETKTSVNSVWIPQKPRAAVPTQMSVGAPFIPCIIMNTIHIPQITDSDHLQIFKVQTSDPWMIPIRTLFA